MKPLLIILLIAFSGIVFPQDLITSVHHLTAFTDYRNYFFVFDNGSFRQLEHHPVQEYKIGDACLAYIDNSNNLKAYCNGRVHMLSAYVPDNFFTAGNMVAFANGKTLSVFDHGETRVLSNAAVKYFLEDSILAFYDEAKLKLMAYQDGSLREADDIIFNDIARAPEFEIGKNTVAYINYDNQFKSFYRCRPVVLETTPPETFKAGKNIVAYEDAYSQTFKVFYNDSIETPESMKPKSYKVADDLVSYIDAAGNFKIFYRGKTYTVSTFEPDFYHAEGNLVIFYDRNYFQVFFDGKIYTVEKNAPAEYKSGLSTLAYKDELGFLKIFSEGQSRDIPKEKAVDFEVSGNVVLYRTGINDITVFSNGKIYHP